MLFGPFPGDLFKVTRIQFVIEVEAVAGELEAFSAMLAFSEGDDVGAYLVQELRLQLAVGGGRFDSLCQGHKLGSKPLGEEIG